MRVGFTKSRGNCECHDWIKSLDSYSVEQIASALALHWGMLDWGPTELLITGSQSCMMGRFTGKPMRSDVSLKPTQCIALDTSCFAFLSWITVRFFSQSQSSGLHVAHYSSMKYLTNEGQILRRDELNFIKHPVCQSSTFGRKLVVGLLSRACARKLAKTCSLMLLL